MVYKEEESKKSAFAQFGDDLRSRLITGILALLPLSVTFLLLRFLFNLFAGILSPVLKHIGRDWPNWMISTLSIVLIAITVYLVGLLATGIVGRKIISWFEAVIARIPVVNTVYATAKQVVDSIGVNKKQMFEKVVLVHYPNPDCRALGFQTGTIRDQDGAHLVKVFIPTAPNPTSGFLFLATAETVQDANLTVEQAIKMIVSGGLIAPAQLPSAAPVPKS